MSMSEKRRVLIDNDPLILKLWQYHAVKAKVELDVFSAVADFLSVQNKFENTKTLIYLDRHLGDDLKGEKEAKKLYENGFREIYLVTADRSGLDHLGEYITGVISKRPPF